MKHPSDLVVRVSSFSSRFSKTFYSNGKCQWIGVLDSDMYHPAGASQAIGLLSEGQVQRMTLAGHFNTFLICPASVRP